MPTKNITPQKKVKRLSYIKMILNMFKISEYYSTNIFNKKIELEAEKYHQDLLKYTNKTGIIKVTKTGNSSKPYIKASISLKLLYSQKGMYRVSKYGKFFNVLDSILDNQTDNYFQLSKYQQSFFLFSILENDYLYLSVLLDLIYAKNGKTLKAVKQEFQKLLIEKLQTIVKNSDLITRKRVDIATKLQKIRNWKKPEVYLERIIEPRVNWLLDLDILDKDEFKKKNLVLSKNGVILYQIYNDSFAIPINFFDLINEIYELNATKIDKDDFKLIDNYIDTSFGLFKTIAPNRVTASQAILYSCYMMLFKEKKVVNFSTIQDYLSSKENEKFIYDWYKTEQDGSIRRKR